MIKASIILLVAHAAIPLLRRRSAAERHGLWAAALALAALLPVLTWLLPSWEPAWAQRVADTWLARFSVRAIFDTALPVANSGDIVVRATGVESADWTFAAALPLVWAAGTFISLLALARQAWLLKRLTLSAVVAAPRHGAIAARAARSLGLSAPVLLSCERVGVPLAWGVKRSRILLPPASADWPDERVWAVCAHEMAHVARGDWLTHLCAEIACRVYWFNPLFWMARNRLGRESERAADDIVIELGATGADYASHLLEIVRASRMDASVTPTVAMARASGLERRIAALLSVLVNRARLTRGRAMAILASASAIAGPLAALGASAGATIEIHTSNLPPIVDTAAQNGLVSDDRETVPEIRVLERATAGDTPPRVAQYTTPPLYSDEARRRGIEGTVVIRARIETTGRVSSARVASGLGFGLDQNALVALRQWQFQAGTRNGLAAPLDVELDIPFTLQSDAINAQIANDMVSLVGPGVTPPQAVRVANIRPRLAGAAGTVVLDVVLLEDGTPRIVRILRSLGADADDMAVRAFEQWRFSPAQKDGRPIKVRMNAAVRFHG